MKKARRSREPHLGVALGMLASKECHALQQALAAHKDRHGGIHDARRSCRRLRSLLALLARASDDEHIHAADKALRKLTHSFSELRDAHVAIRTAQRLAGPHASLPAPLLIQQLEARSDALLDDALRQDPEWAQRRESAEHLAKSIDALNWKAMTPALTRRSLKHSAKRMKKARRKAQEARTNEAFHRWRRRSRQLRYQLQFLRNARHATGAKKRRIHQHDNRIRQLDLITDRLGWRQDFQVFLQTLDKLPPMAEVTALRAALAKTPATTTKTPLPQAKDPEAQ
jgi:CHAD domain-containing protein